MNNLNTIVIKKKRYVLVPESEYKKMVQGIPPVPDKSPSGNYPALPYIKASLARKIVRDREKAGMSQRELAGAAGIRVEILNRAERGVSTPNDRTLAKIEDALVRAGLERKAVKA